MPNIFIRDIYGLKKYEFPSHVNDVKILKNNLLNFMSNYNYQNLKLVLLDQNKNYVFLDDSDKIYNNDKFILSIVPIVCTNH